jgi:hypothetical protein
MLAQVMAPVAVPPVLLEMGRMAEQRVSMETEQMPFWESLGGVLLGVVAGVFCPLMVFTREAAGPGQ